MIASPPLNFCFLFGTSLTSRVSKNESIIATPTCEMEYKALFIDILEVILLRRLICHTQVQKLELTTIFCDGDG